jgi:hypothetical protein
MSPYYHSNFKQAHVLDSSPERPKLDKFCGDELLIYLSFSTRHDSTASGIRKMERKGSILG